VSYEEIVKLLAENLTIEIEQVQEFGPVQTIKVKLLLFNTVISVDVCDLPELNK